MITTEINILEHIELLQDDIDIIKEYAETDAIEKLMKITDNSLYEFDLDFSFEIICRVKVSKKVLDRVFPEEN